MLPLGLEQCAAYANGPLTPAVSKYFLRNGTNAQFVPTSINVSDGKMIQWTWLNFKKKGGGGEIEQTTGEFMERNWKSERASNREVDIILKCLLFTLLKIFSF